MRHFHIQWFDAAGRDVGFDQFIYFYHAVYDGLRISGAMQSDFPAHRHFV